MTQTLMTQDKFEQQIDQIAESIKNLKRKTESAKDEAKEAVSAELEKLLGRTQEMKKEIAATRTKGERSWDEIKGGMEKAWTELKQGYEKAQARFQ